jgi:hypothetical protein
VLTSERFGSARKRVEIPLCAATVKDRNFLPDRLISHLPSKEVEEL